MKPLVLTALAVPLATTAARAEPRIFTNSEGQTVKATLVALEDKEAVLRLTNRKIARIPMETLSADDQAFVRKWWEENKDKLDPMDFVLTIDKDTDALDRKVQRSGGNVGGGNRNNQNNFAPETKRERSDEYIYTAKLENYLPRDIEDIEVAYTIYKRVSKHDKQGSDTFTEEIDGSTSIRLLKALGTAEFETEAVVCEDTSKTGGRGPREWHRETLRGVVFTLSKGGREFLRQSDPETLIDQLEREEER